MPAAPRMPVVFFGHGSPMNALAPNRYADAWRALGARIPRPRAILSVSAHWYTRGSAVTAMAQPRTIHDFYGFPPPLYELSYPAPGDPALAARVRALAAPAEVQPDSGWGLDHGTWQVLLHAFPGADVPVVQLSIDGTQPGSYHYALGRRPAPLRDEGVALADRLAKAGVRAALVEAKSLPHGFLRAAPYAAAARSAQAALGAAARAALHG